MLWIWFWGCFTTTPQASKDESSDLRTILSNTPKEEQELKALDLLRDHPEQFAQICPFILSQEGKETCQTYAARPHLWTISSQAAPVWKGGYFFSRIF